MDTHTELTSPPGRPPSGDHRERDDERYASALAPPTEPDLLQGSPLWWLLPAAVVLAVGGALALAVIESGWPG